MSCARSARGRKLQRSAPRKILARVAAENAHDGRVAPGGEALGYGLAETELTALAERIEKRLPAGLKGRFAAQFRKGVVGHAVAYYEDVFHILPPVSH